MLFGLPLVVRPTSCWQLSWDELETNQQSFQAFCHCLRVSPKRGRGCLQRDGGGGVERPPCQHPRSHPASGAEGRPPQVLQQAGQTYCWLCVSCTSRPPGRSITLFWHNAHRFHLPGAEMAAACQIRDLGWARSQWRPLSRHLPGPAALRLLHPTAAPGSAPRAASALQLPSPPC